MASIYDLAKAKAEVTQKFDTLEANRKQIVQTIANLQQQLNQVLTEQARYQGEFRMLERLEKDSATTPTGGNHQEASVVEGVKNAT